MACLMICRFVPKCRSLGESEKWAASIFRKPRRRRAQGRSEAAGSTRGARYLRGAAGGRARGVLIDMGAAQVGAK
jgi:hypothetical protein